MVNKDFCLSSYMAFRYIWKDGVDFAEGFQHKNFRPVDAVFKNWNGPRGGQFREDIPMGKLTGNQKWQLWCAEQFLKAIR